eukprot:GHRQ01001452.1.p1 GENE.GHRQ01001452.1~~GHRQ01001452.1.p1  ORF type:complete len:190 (+),score=43.20 GHRQ01001452.1:18-587(+)
MLLATVRVLMGAHSRRADAADVAELPALFMIACLRPRMLRLAGDRILQAIGSSRTNQAIAASCRNFTTGTSVSMADVRHVPAAEAAQLLESGYTYLDVRTPEEFVDGHVKDSVNIPFMLRKTEGMVPNEEFVQQVKQQFPNQEQQLVVGCKSGGRSTKACAALAQDYTSLVMNATGWDGWVAADLPAAK